MKFPKKVIVLGFAAAFLLSFGFSGVSSAQTELTDEQLKRINNNCLSIKNTLNQLRSSDALLRVNRGQLYEAVGGKLMNNFNSRVSSNGRDAKGLTLTTTNYQTALTTFRDDYKAYALQLSSAIKIDCATQPTQLHAAIIDARQKRAKVHTDVIRLNQYIDDYRSGVSDFLINFERTSGNN